MRHRSPSTWSRRALGGDSRRRHRTTPRRALWIPWLMVLAILANGLWVPFHLATEHHHEDGAAGRVLHSLGHAATGHEHHADQVEGGHHDHGFPHHPHPAVDHEPPLFRGDAGPGGTHPPLDLVALSPVLPDLEPRRAAAVAPEGGSRAPPRASVSDPRLARAPPAG